MVALPRLLGPGLSGLPADGGGFLPVDEYGPVRGVDRVWTAGDATDVPIKQGGVAAQLADVGAGSIAERRVLPCSPRRLRRRSPLRISPRTSRTAGRRLPRRRAERACRRADSVLRQAALARR